MKTLHQLLFSSLFIVLLFACSSSDDENGISDTGPSFSISELQGTWTATSLIFSYSGQGPVPEPTSYDVVAEGGSATLVVQSSGRFTLTVRPMGLDNISFSGRMYFEDGEFFAIQFDDDPPNDPTYFGETLTSTTFSLNGGPDTAEWDFDGDGNDEAASVFLSFERES